MAAEIIVAPIATTETIEDHFARWERPAVNGVSGFLTWTWDHRAESAAQLENAINTKDFDDILFDVVYSLEEDETISHFQGLEEAALEWLEDNAEEIIDAIKASLED